MHKIIFLDQCLSGGGAERILCTIMRSLNPKEFEIHLVIVTELRDLKYLVPEHVIVHELGICNTRKALLPYRKKIREISPETVFSTTGRTTILSLLGRVWNHSHRIIARYPNMPSRQIASGELVYWRMWLTKIVYRFADIVISQSDEMAFELQTYFMINKKKIMTIPNPIDKEYISQSLDGQPDPFDSSKINIVASGRLVEQKGFDVLIRAFVEVKNHNQKALLHILGADFDGNRRLLEIQTETLGIRDSVKLYGYVTNPYPFYKFCDLFVLSSRWEGCPNALLECLYLGKRLVATKCVPIVERMVSIKQGVLAEVNDAEGLSDAMNTALTLDVLGSSEFDRACDCSHFVNLFLGRTNI